MIRRVLVLEDHDATRDALVRALGEETSWLVVGVATKASALAEADGPRTISVALVDLRLGPERGVDAIRELVERGVPCVALTVVADADDVIAALRAGARGYLLKSEPIERLVGALHDALRGDAPMSSGPARYLVDALQPVDPLVPLTPRERELLVALARGLTYAECADVLEVKLTTIQGYVKSVYAKLEVTTKTEAAAWAIRHGLVR